MKRIILLLVFIALSVAGFSQNYEGISGLKYLGTDTIKVEKEIVLNDDTIRFNTATIQTGQTLVRMMLEDGKHIWTNGEYDAVDSITFNIATGVASLWKRGSVTDSCLLDGRYLKITDLPSPYTDDLARRAISITTNGDSGAATYDSITGVLNIPQYANSSGTGFMIVRWSYLDTATAGQTAFSLPADADITSPETSFYVLGNDGQPLTPDDFSLSLVGETPTITYSTAITTGNQPYVGYPSTSTVTNAITLTTEGASGPATYDGTILNIPQYVAGTGIELTDLYGDSPISYNNATGHFGMIGNAYKPYGWFPTWTEVTSKPTFATVATTGAYSDLTGKPAIPTSIWNLTGIDKTGWVVDKVLKFNASGDLIVGTDNSGAGGGITLADLSASNPINYNNLTGAFSMVPNAYAPYGTVSFPGFGTSHILAAYGDHAHSGYEPTFTKGDLTESITGLQFNATRQVIGGAATLSMTSGYGIPTTTEISNWNTRMGKVLLGSNYIGVNSGDFSQNTTDLIINKVDFAALGNSFPITSDGVYYELHNISLSSLTDVGFTYSRVDKDILQFNGTTQKWEQESLSNAGIAALSHTHSYLPLSGGTLSGGLIGTTSSMNSTSTASSFVFGATGWSIAESAGKLVFKYNGTAVMSLDSSGNLKVASEVYRGGL